MNQRATHSRRRRFHGLTLVELLMSMTIASVLLVGLASAVRVSTLSLESPNSAAANASDAGDALDRLNAELRLAKSFSERTATAVTFTIPDQTGDGWPETVRYAWAGSGTPLTRTLNSAPSPVPLIDDVRSLNFLFLTKTIQPPTIQSGEQQLIAYNTGSNSVTISPTLWAGEYFNPTLPSDTTSWKVTRVRLYMKIAKRVTTGEIQVALYKVKGKAPLGGPLETYHLQLSKLGIITAAVDIPFSAVSGLGPTEGLFLQVQALVKPAQNVSLAIQNNLATAPKNMEYSTSATQGATWVKPLTPASARYEVYGTVTRLAP